LSKKGENNPNYGKKIEGSGSPAKVIEVFDLEEKTMSSYNSIHFAARALNISPSIIVKYFSLINRSLIKVDILSQRYRVR